MNLVFLGTGDFAAPTLRALYQAGYVIRRAISQPDRPAGRGLKVEPTAIHAAADELGIAHVQTADVNALDVGAHFGDAELGFVVAFGQKIGPAVLSTLPLGCINLHGSLLPKYRGAAPYQWAILNGESETGVTTFQLNERWDAGAIWDLAKTPIGATETADELHDRLAVIGAELAVRTLQRVERGETPQPQDTHQATRAPKLRKQDGYLDWSWPAARVARWINGLWSWPCATADFLSRTGKVERVQLARAAAALDESEPGPVVAGGIRCDGTVQCGKGAVRILEIKPAGRGKMSFESFVNGRNVGVGDRFTTPSGP